MHNQNFLLTVMLLRACLTKNSNMWIPSPPVNRSFGLSNIKNQKLILLVFCKTQTQKFLNSPIKLSNMTLSYSQQLIRLYTI